MPRFFFDLHDGTNYVKDDDGFDLPDREAVRERLARIVTRIARDITVSDQRQDFFAIARDEQDRILFRAHLSLDVESVDGL